MHFARTETTELSDEKKEVLTRLLDIETMPIYEVMMPVQKIVQIDRETTANDALEKLANTGGDFCIYVDDNNRIIQLLHRDYIYRCDPDTPIMLTDAASKTIHLPPTISVGKAITQLFESESLEAVIDDENGNPAGIIDIDQLLMEMSKRHIESEDGEKVAKLSISGETTLRDVELLTGEQFAALPTLSNNWRACYRDDWHYSGTGTICRC